LLEIVRVRIAVVSTPCVPVPPPEYGGTELVVGEICKGLVAGGHAVTLFTCGGSRAPVDLRARFAVPRWPPNPYVELDRAAWAIETILADARGFDLIHAHVPAAVPFARFIETPMVYTVHHDRHSQPAAGLWDSIYARARAQLVCISERQRQLSPGLHDASVIHHGLDPAQYRFGDGAGDYAAFLGRFDREKGAHHAIDAAVRARVPILLAGSPHEQDDYFEASVRPRLQQPGVVALGEMGGRYKVDFLRRARALLFPIEWEEPFGLVMIEAMLCGTPVIAFAGGAVNEVVEPGLTGWVVGSVEEMAARLRSTVGFDRARCRRRAVERWSTSRMVRDYLRLYAALAQVADERRGAAAPRP
jgi:glycosyltransferase involved in cell wall biosynthesis